METLQRTANRGSLATGYEISNSLKLEADNTEYLYKANDSGTNRKTFTVSMWFKRTELSNDYMQLWQGGDSGGATRLGFYGGTPKEAIWVDLSSGGTYKRSYSTQVLRDTSAWYHVVLAVDTTQAVEANRMLVWLNGVNLTSWSQQQIPAQNFDLSLLAGGVMKWGAYDNTYYKMCGYIADCHYLDGVTAQNSDFGEVDEDSGIWKPIKYTGTYGGNGCYLKFDDSSDLGADSSGNGNDFTLNNISAADQATDTPTNNFATGNPLVYFSNPPMTTFNAISEGATQFKKGANGWETMTSSIAVTSGKWYIEIQNISVPDSAMMGITPADSVLIFLGGRVSYHMGASSGDGGVAQYGQNGTLYKEGVGITYSPSPTWVGGTTVQGIALDMDNGKVYFAKDNTWMNNGDPTSGSTGTGAVDIPDYTTKPYVFGYSLYANNHYGRMNFGGYTSGSISSAASDANGYGTFEYAPPTGYYALCTKNLAEYG